MQVPNITKCIFCFQDKVKSAEHVMPRTLGGNLTIHTVCGDCNRSLSHLDQSLADASILTMNRMVEQPGAYRSAQMATEDGSYEVKVGNKFKPEIKTRITFKKNDNGGFQLTGNGDSPEQYRKMFKVLRKQVEKNGVRSIKSFPAVSEGKEETGFKLVFNRSDEVIFRPSLATANAVEEYEVMVGLLERKLDEIESAILNSSKAFGVTINQPGLHFEFTPHFGLNFRGCAKIAYTFMAHLFGSNFVMHSNFDGLRKYILTGDGADDLGALWSGVDNKEDALRPSRYVAWFHGYHEKFGMKFAREGTHVIYITPVADRYWVFFEFYGQHVFVVDVGSAEIKAPLPIFYEFDFIERSHREIPPEELEALRVSWMKRGL